MGNAMPSVGGCISQATAVYFRVLGMRTMQVNALPGDLGHAKRSQITSSFILIYDSSFSG
jgi:hypothetical protein